MKLIIKNLPDKKIVKKITMKILKRRLEKFFYGILSK